MLGLFGSAQLDIAIEALSPDAPQRPGSSIPVTIRLQASKSVKARQIRAGLVRLHRYQVIDQYTDSDGDRQDRTTWRIDEHWITQEQLATGALPAGSHQYTFAWSIPTDALPSYEGTLAQVRWLIKVVVDRSMARDITRELPLRIASAAPPMTDSRELHGTTENNPLVSMAFRLPRCSFVEGETIRGTLLLQPLQAVEARSIRLELLRQERVTTGDRINAREVQAHRVDLAGKTALQPGTPAVHAFAITVPVTGCPSCQTEHASAAWELKAVVDRPLKSDLCVRQPLIIATSAEEAAPVLKGTES